MKSRILSLFLTIALCIAFMPASVFAEGEGSTKEYQAEYFGEPQAIEVCPDGENVAITPELGDYIIIHKDGTDIRCEFKNEFIESIQEYQYVLYDTDETDNNWIDQPWGWSGWYVSPTEADIQITGYSYDDNDNIVRWTAYANLKNVNVYNEVASIEFKPASTTLYADDITITDNEGTYMSLWQRALRSHGDQSWPSQFAVGDQLVVTYENGSTKTFTNKDYYYIPEKMWMDGFFCGDELLDDIYMRPVGDLAIGSNEVEIEYHARTTTFNITIKEGKAPVNPQPTPVNPQPTPVVNPTYVAPVVPAEIQDLPTVKISKPKAAKKAVTVKWKKVNKKNLKKIGGIEIQVESDPDFTNIVKTATVGKKKTSKKIKGLTSKQTYWVRIRAYNNAADGKHVSAWKSKKFKAK
ncbi:MAG: hypothetical protein IJI11_01925 [Mogibacterium sp.]|nr:hypothetical protein [Mogibacterium sp.]